MLVAIDTPQRPVGHVGGSVRRGQKTYGYGSANGALLIYYFPLRSSARTRRRLLAQRPYRPCRVALARGTLALPDRCAAVHRFGKNSSVLAVPRSMSVRTLSKYTPTSRSILSALATRDIKLAFPTLARRDPMNNQFLRPTA